MANPMPNEKEIYEKITRENLNIPQPIWNLIDHHVRNDLYAIALIVGSFITGEEKENIPAEAGEKIIKHVEAIKVFLDKLGKL